MAYVRNVVIQDWSDEKRLPSIQAPEEKKSKKEKGHKEGYKREKEDWVERFPIFRNLPVTYSPDVSQNVCKIEVVVFQEEIPFWSDDTEDSEVIDYLEHYYLINWRIITPSGLKVYDGTIQSVEWRLDEEEDKNIAVGLFRTNISSDGLTIDEKGIWSFNIELIFGR